MKIPSRKNLIWTAAALLLFLLVFNALRPRPVEVDAAPVTRGPMKVTVDEDGETRIREPYLISAPLAGRLLRIELEPGDVIRKGQVLAAIDPGEPGLLDARTKAEAQARVNAAEARYRVAVTKQEIAQAEAAKAARYLDRDLARFQSGNISQPTLEDTRHAERVATGNVDAARSEVDISKFELEQARAAMVHSKSMQEQGSQPSDRHFRIESPIDGVVLRRFQESSTVIASGQPILEIGDPSDLEIRIDVLSQDAVRITPGDRVFIEHWGGDRPLLAYVRRIDPSAFTKISALGVDEQRVWVFADFGPVKSGKNEPEKQGRTADPTLLSQSTHKQQLGDGYRVEARIVVWEKENVLKLPSGALFRQAGQWNAYAIRDGRAVMAPLGLGQNNGIEAEILSGLNENDRVVLHPGDRVAEATRLKERTE